MLDECKSVFDATHPGLGGLHVPPRHQAVIATLLERSYEKQSKHTKNQITKMTKKLAKVKAAADDPNTIADGMVYGDIKTGHLKAWEKAKISSHARVFVVQTVSARGDKRRKRAFVPLYGVMNERPFTPKQIARLTRYEKPDALLLFPNTYLGSNNRDLNEAAYRVAIEGLKGTENPILQGQEVITEIETSDPNFPVRWTDVDLTDGFALAAFSVIQKVPQIRFGRPQIPTGSGFAFLTTPRGDSIYLRPSFIENQTHMPKRELAWLSASIEQAYPFEPERAEALIIQLKAHWSKVAKHFPAKITPVDPI